MRRIMTRAYVWRSTMAGNVLTACSENTGSLKVTLRIIQVDSKECGIRCAHRHAAILDDTVNPSWGGQAFGQYLLGAQQPASTYRRPLESKSKSRPHLILQEIST